MKVRPIFESKEDTKIHVLQMKSFQEENKKNKAKHMFGQWSIFAYKDLDILLFFLIQ